ncbi:aminotransferase class I/II-fold pyridoxal phosphate-dependent enzyme [Streptomyces sp. WP-1]|uniref:aminotransferase class I/II-fold pyridoxal phosphate-dependent enzyme n=1 Tax=Streptomyces sp. WP-1 TaxID=3041497 RepID=UPI002647E71F|nr:aminotransferase class I/II-fold pyridoxal phosphate-dependent enzyme [Streptomyces sp. WP-1]WKE68510.1 aminotransferase class I/II-fold pyridoxal phosphate-dependent enzyme [Streptomyces sp. WP-1]
MSDDHERADAPGRTAARVTVRPRARAAARDLGRAGGRDLGPADGPDLGPADGPDLGRAGGRDLGGAGGRGAVPATAPCTVRHHEFPPPSHLPAGARPHRSGGLIGLDIADMDFAAHPLASAAAHLRARTETMRYTLASETLRDRIAGWYADRHAWQVRRDAVLLLPFGVKTALRLALETCADLTRPVLVCTPVYSGILKVVRAAGAVLRPVALTTGAGLRHVLDPEALDRAFRETGARTLVLCSPHNPVGRVWHADELTGAARAAHRAGALVLSDEVHSDLVHPGSRHIPWGAVAADPDWIVLHSVGKTFNTSGLQTCFAVTGTARHRAALLRALGSWGYYEGSYFGDAVAESLLSPATHAWLDARVARVAGVTAAVRDALAELPVPLRSSPPEAGFLLWVDARALPTPPTEPDLAAWIHRRTGVRMLDGTRFGGEPGMLRLNCATDPRLLAEALSRLTRFVGSLPGVAAR